MSMMPLEDDLLLARLNQYAPPPIPPPEDYPVLEAIYAEPVHSSISSASEPASLSPDTPDFTDDVTWQARDRMLAQAFDFSEMDFERSNIDEAVELQPIIRELGIQIEDFDPAANPPPLFDEANQTAYWIGVYQPDESSQAITSILSIGHNAETGQPEAHLAPVATGDPEQAQQAAQYLLGVAQKSGDVEHLLDAAEGMAVATQQHELWGQAQEITADTDIAFSPAGMEIE